MNARHFSLFWLATLSLLFAASCAPHEALLRFFEKGGTCRIMLSMATKLEALRRDLTPTFLEVTRCDGVFVAVEHEDERIWDLQLEDAVHLALENSVI